MGREKAWRVVRARVLNRDEHRCRQCGLQPNDDRLLHAHHRKPRHLFEPARSGDYDGNLLTLCGLCHRREEARARHRYRFESVRQRERWLQYRVQRWVREARACDMQAGAA